MSYAPGAAIDDKLGLGVGLRNSHFDFIQSERPEVDWFEAISENFMDSSGRPRAVLRWLAERYPVALHGVSLSIGGCDPLDRGYLTRLRKLAQEIGARWVSDHLCWTGALGMNSHDLLPLPLNEETLAHVAARVRIVQDILERPLVLENPSAYVQFRSSTIREPEFLRALCDATGCRLLLDVNNVYVTCFNAGADPLAYLDAFPFDRVVQLHIAGHQHCGSHVVDTHDRPVCEAVWSLFEIAWRRTNGAATLLEWDGDVPEFEVVHAEVLRARDFISDGGADRRSVAPSEIPADVDDKPSTPLGFLSPNLMTVTSYVPREPASRQLGAAAAVDDLGAR